jgi:hypothetical protein
MRACLSTGRRFFIMERATMNAWSALVDTFGRSLYQRTAHEQPERAEE